MLIPFEGDSKVRSLLDSEESKSLAKNRWREISNAAVIIARDNINNLAGLTSTEEELSDDNVVHALVVSKS